MTRNLQMKLAIAAAELNIGFIKWHLSRLADESEPHSSWKREAAKLQSWLNDMSTMPPYKVFVLGNKKLPFYNFSVLPIVTCPGAGACAKFCYSLKAWRYPAAFFRQLQNTILIKTQSAHITAAFYRLRQNVTVRLYVDGDFDSVDTITFWFNLLHQRPDLKVYGYSKSWNELLAYTGIYPTNYKLNLSSGHAHNNATKALVQKLPITRGDFIALPVLKDVIGKYKTKNYLASLATAAKSAGIAKYFACPGKCGPCTKKGHACGSDSFNDVPILIGIH